MCVCSYAYATALLRASGFRARSIDGVDCGLFSIHAPLGQTTLRVGGLKFLMLMYKWGRRLIEISRSLIWSKTLMQLLFNPCGEFW